MAYPLSFLNGIDSDAFKNDGFVVSALPSSFAPEQSSTCTGRCLEQTSHTLVLRGILFRWGGGLRSLHDIDGASFPHKKHKLTCSMS
jgi:hypothetical protein